MGIFTLLMILALYILKKEEKVIYQFFRNKITSLFQEGISRNLNDFISTKEELNQIKNELNIFFKNEVKFFTIFENLEPEVKYCDKYTSDEISYDDILKKSRDITDNGFTNETHVLLKNYTDLDSSKVQLEAEYTDFSMILALRDKNIKPEIISAGAVILDNKKEELIVHIRSEKSATYPAHYHILGGAFSPVVNEYGAMGDRSLSHTVQREIAEESNLTISINDIQSIRYRTFSKELATGFIQYEYLGLTVDVNDSLTGNWEGDILPIKFSELENKLNTLTWVPSGKAHILAWLALGAPNTKYFTYEKARDIYESIVLNGVKKRSYA